MRAFAIAMLLVFCACGRQAQSTLPDAEATSHEDLEELRIEAAPRETGGYDFNIYDASDVFDRAVAHSHADECDEAVPLYERVISQFPESRLAPLSHYNIALCHKAEGELLAAARRFERIAVEYPDSPDLRDSRFQLLELYVLIGSEESAATTTSEDRTHAGESFFLLSALLLEDESLTPDQRVEVLAREAQMYFSQENYPRAALRARRAIGYARSRPLDDRVADDYFIGAATFVFAETVRIEAEAIEITGDRATQSAALDTRAGLVTRAQHAYFDTMRVRDARWSAAAGFRIGEMYQSFWNAIMVAPVPPEDPPLTGEDLEVFTEAYRRTMASEIEPLLRHAIRYWELTLVMVDRTAIDSEWEARIETALEETRELLIDYQAAANVNPDDMAENAVEDPEQDLQSTAPAPETTP